MLCLGEAGDEQSAVESMLGSGVSEVGGVNRSAIKLKLLLIQLGVEGLSEFFGLEGDNRVGGQRENAVANLEIGEGDSLLLDESLDISCIDRLGEAKNADLVIAEVGNVLIWDVLIEHQGEVGVR